MAQSAQKEKVDSDRQVPAVNEIEMIGNPDNLEYSPEKSEDGKS